MEVLVHKIQVSGVTSCTPQLKDFEFYKIKIYEPCAWQNKDYVCLRLNLGGSSSVSLTQRRSLYKINVQKNLIYIMHQVG